MAWTKVKTAVAVGAVVLLAAGTATVHLERHYQAQQYAPALEPWSDAGAATPKAALQSLAWALTHGKFDRAQELMQWDEKGREFVGDPAYEHQLVLMSVMAPAVQDLESFKVLSITPPEQPDEIIVKLEKTFKDRRIVPFAVTAKLRRTGRQWRVVGKLEYSANGNFSSLLPFSGSF